MHILASITANYNINEKTNQFIVYFFVFYSLSCLFFTYREPFISILVVHVNNIRALQVNY